MTRPRSAVPGPELTRPRRVRTSLPLPAGSPGAVLEKHALLREVEPDAIGGGEVAAAARRVTFLDGLLDLGDGHRRLLVLGLPQAQHAEHPIELVERRSNRLHVAGAELVGVYRRVQRTD